MLLTVQLCVTCGDLLGTSREVCGFNSAEEQVEAHCYWCGQAPHSQHDQRQELCCQQHVPYHCQPCEEHNSLHIYMACLVQGLHM